MSSMVHMMVPFMVFEDNLVVPISLTWDFYGLLIKSLRLLVITTDVAMSTTISFESESNKWLGFLEDALVLLVLMAKIGNSVVLCTLLDLFVHL